MDIFSTYLALSVLLITLLAMNISRLRMKNKIANGDGQNKELAKAIRAHVNSLEHIIPFSLLLFALKDDIGTSLPYTYLSFGFLVIRLMHSYSMLSARFRMRQVTAALTYLLEVIACILLLFSAL